MSKKHVLRRIWDYVNKICNVTNNKQYTVCIFYVTLLFHSLYIHPNKFQEKKPILFYFSQKQTFLGVNENNQHPAQTGD